MNEVKDAVATGIHSSNQIRPRYWTLRRNAGSKLPKVALSDKFREVGHFSFTHELLQQLRIHAVDAQNDEALISVPLRATGPARGKKYRRYQEQGDE